MTTTWKYKNFNVYSTYGNLTDVVYSYSYIVTVTDGISSAVKYGLIRLNFDLIANYVPFNELTEVIVQQWTEASIDTVEIIKNLTESVIAKNAETRNELAAPWEPVVPTTPAA